MQPLAIQTFSNLDHLSTDTAIAIAAVKSPTGIELLADHFDSDALTELPLQRLGFKAKFGENISVQLAGFTVIVLGLGDAPDLPEKWRQLGGTLARAAFNSSSLAIGFTPENNLVAFVEGIRLGALPVYSLKSGDPKPAITALLLHESHQFSALDGNNLEIVTEAVATTRDLVNMPANLLYPESLVRFVAEHALPKSVKIETWDVKELQRENCAGILAVGGGSSRAPKLIKLTYAPKVYNTHLALVGKGITFDTGGLSLKPREGMAGMKYDMAGAATVFNSLAAIAKLELPIAVTAWMCVAENMPSGSAARPNDVITMRNKKTVEVLNTDAEGRLVLADGLILASETKPNLIVDIATLTGAATVALGKRFAGVMGNAAGTTPVMRAFEASGETAWMMPMPEELRELLDTPIADIANAKLGNAAGGMILGAHFLSEFVGKDAEGEQLPWAHIDFAGPANNDGAAHGYTPKGATGFGVRTLVKLAIQLADS